MLVRNEEYSLVEIITYMKETQCQDDDFCLYGQDDGDLTSNKKNIIAGYPKVKDDEEIYPPVVQERKLSYLYSGEQFADVILSVIDQKKSASIDEYIKALNYYSEYDDFLEL